MARKRTQICSLARGHTKIAVNVLVRIAQSKDATPAARVSAANALLDRGWGKATQLMESNNDGSNERPRLIERIIVHPENSDSEGI
jgi:hypothetical protein